MSKNFQNKGQAPAAIPPAQAQAIAQTLLQQATAFHQKGELAQARTIYESLLKVQPRHLDGLKSFAALAYQTQQFPLAIGLLSKAIEINPKSAALYSNIGLPLQAQHRFEEALVNYDKAIALEPNFVEAHNNRGNILRELKRFSEALISYDQAISLKADFALAHYGRGMVLAELRQFDEALACQDKAIALRPNYAEAHHGRGVVLTSLERFEEALASYDTALTLKPDYADTYYHRGHLLWQLNRLGDALVSFDRAIVYKPYHPEGYFNRGKILQELDRSSDALTAYEKAVALDPDHSEALQQRSNLLQKIERSASSTQSMIEDAAVKNENANSVHNEAPSQDSWLAKPRTYTMPIRPGFEGHYVGYRYVTSYFADKNIITIDGREIRVAETITEPEIVIFENVLSDVECELLIELSKPKLQRSGTYDFRDPSARGKVNQERTSEGTGFLRGENALLQTIETRLAKLMNFPVENGEEMQILHYGVGAEYRPHFDFFPPEVASSAVSIQASGQRIVTLVMYLNDVEEGGETIFPEINFAVTPRKGGAVYFSYCDKNGKLDRLSLHGGAPVTRGEKWIATKWIRQKAWRVGK